VTREKRRPPMGEAEFKAWQAKMNRRAEPFIPLANCFGCGKPIEDEHVVLTSYDPPRFYHLECEPED